MMKICFFTKYPPIEGGVSSRSYWLARGLGEREIEVHIITSGLEENLWREKIDFEDPGDLANYQPKNVFVHSLDAIGPELNRDKNLLLRQNYESRLGSLGIETIKRYECEIIDSHYLLPYGVAAYLAKKITGRPLILRHAVSDINRIISDKAFHFLFQKIFSEANLIFTYKVRNKFFKELDIPSEKLYFGFNYGIDPKYFNSNVLPLGLEKYGLKTSSDLPIITFIGKPHPFKGVYQLVEAASQIKEDFLLLFVTGGPGLEQFKEYIKKFPSLKNKHHFLGFIPPWKIPSVLKRSTCLVQLETDFPFAFHFPIQPLEAMAVGTCPIISEEVYGAYKNLPGLEKEENILVVDPKNIKELKNLLEKIIKNKSWAEETGKKASKVFNQEAFSVSISVMIEIYKALSKKNKSFRACLEELRGVILKYL